MPERSTYAHGEFSWVDLMAKDMESACKFYEGLFGWTHTLQPGHGGPPYAMFHLHGKDVAGIGQMSPEMIASGMPPVWNSYINVDNIEETAKKATELGATITVPPMKAMEAGWLFFAQDPMGAHIGFWQKNTHCGANIVSEPNTFCWNELACKDIDKAKDFYGALLGWDFADNPMSPSKYYIIKIDGEDKGGLLQMTEEWGDMPPCWSVYFRVDDVNASVAKLQELGGSVHVPPFPIPIGSLSIVADSNGGTFTLIQLTQPM